MLNFWRRAIIIEQYEYWHCYFLALWSSLMMISLCINCRYWTQIVIFAFNHVITRMV